MIEKRIPCCDLLHPDHCLTEKQVSEIAHDIRMDLNLHDLYKQVDQHIMNYVNAAGIDNINKTGVFLLFHFCTFFQNLWE